MTPIRTKRARSKRLAVALFAGITAILNSRAAEPPGLAAGTAQAVMHSAAEGASAADRKARYQRSLHNYRTPDVNLIDAQGEAVDLLSELRLDRPLLMNFIFTSCTAICPVLSATFAQVQKKLGRTGEAVRMVSISIDPEQDSPERLKGYAERYRAISGWRFLTGSRTDIVKVQKAFDAYRGDKTSHGTLTFMRASSKEPWVRIEGFASAADLVAEYRAMLAE
jgi:protein SCO1/2